MNLTQFDWQTIVALLIVLFAIVAFARLSWKSVFGSSSSGCGTSCSNCPAGSSQANGAIKVTKLVQLDSNKPE